MRTLPYEHEYEDHLSSCHRIRLPRGNISLKGGSGLPMCHPCFLKKSSKERYPFVDQPFK